MIDAVIFDWGGTLTPWHTIDFDEAWGSVSADPAVIAALRDAEATVWARSRDEHLSARLEEIYELAAYRPSAEAEAAYHQWWDAHTYLDPQAPAMLAGLRERGLAVGVLSNTIWSRARHEQIFERDGVLDLIDGAVYSSEIAYSKPHPEAFRAALAAVGNPDPARSVYVGDRLFDDVYGAAQVGMRTIHIPHSDIPAEQIGHTLGEPDAVIESLDELLEVIDRWR